MIAKENQLSNNITVKPKKQTFSKHKILYTPLIHFEKIVIQFSGQNFGRYTI